MARDPGSLTRRGSGQIAAAKDILSGGNRNEASNGARVALIGLRGAGKSTLGKLAAERLGWTFVELNAEIERENALSVQEIFAIYGQEGYRRLEQAALRRLTEQPGPLILATSGGIVAEPLTYDLLLQAFYTVWLRARPEEHMNRVREQGHLPTTGSRFGDAGIAGRAGAPRAALCPSRRRAG